MQNVHPYFVHFPIALLSVGVLCDLFGIIFKKDSLRNAGWWIQLFGTAAIVVTVITGLLAESTVGHSDTSHEIMETHKTLELVAVGIFALLFIWRSIQKTLLPSRNAGLPLLIVYLIIGVSAIGIMFYGAHLGGRLVYEFGVGGSAVSQPEGAGHQHNHDKAIPPLRDEAEHHHDTGTQSLVKDTISSPVDTVSGKQKRIHIHKDGKEHTH
jgi:uncharacterized membrane protein